MLATTTGDNQRNWSQLLSYLMLAHCPSVQKSTLHTPHIKKLDHYVAILVEMGLPLPNIFCLKTAIVLPHKPDVVLKSPTRKPAGIQRPAITSTRAVKLSKWKCLANRWYKLSWSTHPRHLAVRALDDTLLEILESTKPFREILAKALHEMNRGKDFFAHSNRLKSCRQLKFRRCILPQTITHYPQFFQSSTMTQYLQITVFAPETQRLSFLLRQPQPILILISFPAAFFSCKIDSWCLTPYTVTISSPQVDESVRNRKSTRRSSFPNHFVWLYRNYPQGLMSQHTCDACGQPLP